MNSLQSTGHVSSVPQRPDRVDTSKGQDSTLNTCPTEDQYIVSHGRNGALGIFTADSPMGLQRGAAVVIQSVRGIELGRVLCAASSRQAQLLATTSHGTLLRVAAPADQVSRGQVEIEIFEAAKAHVQRAGLNLEILDVEMLLAGDRAIVQFVGEETDVDLLAAELEKPFAIAIRFERLGMAHSDHEGAEARCDKPDCGKTGGGGCTSCSTGGGCSSCGSGKIDMRDYFAHLRTKMEASNRVPLV
jgi:hypothetical protein